MGSGSGVGVGSGSSVAGGSGSGVGVGSGVGTELTVAKLKTYVKDVRDNDPGMAYEENCPLAPGSGTHVWRDYTDAEIDTMVDDWCSARGIS